MFTKRIREAMQEINEARGTRGGVARLVVRHMIKTAVWAAVFAIVTYCYIILFSSVAL